MFSTKVKINKLLGEGVFGRVFLEREPHTNQEMAIKEIKNYTDRMKNTVGHFRESVLRELAILRMVNNHPNIITLHRAEYSTELDKIRLVFDRHGNSLADYITRLKEEKKSFSSEQIQGLLYQMINAMSYVHALKIVHRDLKPENMLVDNDLNLKICDFGIARSIQPMDEYPITDSEISMVNPDELKLTNYVVSRWYRSPELLLNLPHSGGTPLDMWSIGCIFIEMHTKKPAFPGSNTFKMMEFILRIIGTPNHNDFQMNYKEEQYIIPASAHSISTGDYLDTQTARELLEGLLRFDPVDRVTADQALQQVYCSSAPAQYKSQPEYKMRSEAERSSIQNYYRYEFSKDRLHQNVTQLIKNEIELYEKKSDLSAHVNNSMFSAPNVDSHSIVQKSAQMDSSTKVAPLV